MTRAGAEFGSQKGEIVFIVKALYGITYDGSIFKYFLAETLDDIGYRPSYADTDVCIRP